MGSKESPERADQDTWGQSSFKGPVGVEKGNTAKSGRPELALDAVRVYTDVSRLILEIQPSN